MGKRTKPEEIVVKLRRVEIVTAQGKSIAEAARSIGVTEQIYYRVSGVREHEDRRGQTAERAGDGKQPFASSGVGSRVDKLILTEAARKPKGYISALNTRNAKRNTAREVRVVVMARGE